MDNKYIKLNIFPIMLEGIVILACLLFKEYYIYINFLFYTSLAIYFYLRKDFNNIDNLPKIKPLKKKRKFLEKFKNNYKESNKK